MIRGTRYPIAPGGIFWSLQGEGHLRGFPMGFIRLAGCSVGCPGCDTNYSVDTRADALEILERAHKAWPVNRDRWVWVTGGEPTDHDLQDLLGVLDAGGHRVALATSGCREVIRPVDWLSVSPHDMEPLRQPYGQELKLVDGLNGLDPEAWAQVYDREVDFFYRYVQPVTVAGKEDPESLARCLDFIRRRPGWALSRQDHVAWGLA